jgi:phenylacetate-CoA ligase
VIHDRQWTQLCAIAKHAFDTTTFWARRFSELGVTSGKLQSAADLVRLPILTKQDLRAFAKEMISTEYLRHTLHHKTTSGSTGVSVEVWVDDPAQQFKRACTLRSDEWTGWRLGERIAAVWGNPVYLKRGWRGRLRNALLDRLTYLDTLKMDEPIMAEFLAGLRRRPPSLLFGHAHSLYLFAQFVQSRGGAIFAPKAIIATAMVLHDWERRTIEGVFECPVTNRYGCEEVSLIACQCERHQGLHVNADGIYVEVLRADGTPAEPGEVGMVVVTDLVNRAMPIIRYQVGDMATWAASSCPCGRGLPVLERIEGRIADYVTTSQGELISGISLTENFAVLVPGIAQLQIVQEDVDRFVFRIVKGADFGPASLERIRSLVTERFGDGVQHECEFVDRISQEPSGKYRFCISKVANRFSAHEVR